MKAYVPHTQQNENAKEILRFVQLPEVYVCALIGPTASGKTVTLDIISEYLENTNYRKIRIRCASNKNAEQFYPIKFAEYSDYKQHLPSLLSAGAKSVPYAGNIISKLIDISISPEKKSDVHNLGINTSLEAQRILNYVEYYIKSSNIVFIIDDIQYIDDHSIGLIHYIFSVYNAQLLEKYSVKIIMSVNNSQKVQFEEFKNRKIYTQIDETIFVESCNYNEFISILKNNKCYNLIDANETEGIYNLTNGNLYIIYYIVQYISSNMRPLDLGEISKNGMLNYLISEILNSKTLNRENIKTLLSFGSLIGSRFDEMELRCNLEKQGIKANETIEEAISSNFIERNDTELYFTHDTIYNFFNRMTEENSVKIHKSIEDCIKKIRPYDYALRAYHAKRAQEHIYASSLIVCNYIRRVESGAQNEIETATIFIKDEACLKFIHTYCSITEKIRNYEYNQALLICQSFDVPLPMMLSVELAIITSEIHLYYLDKKNRVLALRILEVAKNDCGDEYDQFVRVCILLIQAYIQNSMFDKAKALERELIRSSGRRISYDRRSERVRFNLVMICSMYELPEICLKRRLSLYNEYTDIRRNYLSIGIDSLYKLLVNISASCLLTGDLDLCEYFCRAAIDVVTHNQTIFFSGKEALLSNYIVCKYLKNEGSPDSHADELIKVSENTNTEDSILLNINAACIKAEIGLYDEAENILKNNLKIMMDCGDYDEYYLYFNNINLAVIFALKGRMNEALTVFSYAQKVLPMLGLHIVSHLSPRHAALESALNEAAEKQNGFMVNFMSFNIEQKMGATFKFWGRQFLMTDIEIWSLA